jgi:hypothetical protein
MFTIEFMDIPNPDLRYLMLHKYLVEKYVTGTGPEVLMDPQIHRNLFLCQDSVLHKEMFAGFQLSIRKNTHPMFVPHKPGTETPDTSAGFISVQMAALGIDWTRSGFTRFFFCVRPRRAERSDDRERRLERQFFGSSIGRIVRQHMDPDMMENVNYKFIIVGREQDRSYYKDLIDEFTKDLSASVSENEIRFCL